MNAFGEVWIQYHRERLQRQYGAGTFVAVFDGAVIDWGDDRDEVRLRAERVLGENVFVGVIPHGAGAGDHEALTAEYQLYKEAAGQNLNQRRVPIHFDLFKKIGDLDITGRKTELVDGVVVIDGTERRFS